MCYCCAFVLLFAEKYDPARSSRAAAAAAWWNCRHISGIVSFRFLTAAMRQYIPLCVVVVVVEVAMQDERVYICHAMTHADKKQSKTSLRNGCRVCPLSFTLYTSQPTYREKKTQTNNKRHHQRHINIYSDLYWLHYIIRCQRTHFSTLYECNSLSHFQGRRRPNTHWE